MKSINARRARSSYAQDLFSGGFLEQFLSPAGSGASNKKWAAGDGASAANELDI
jgi:hypothetical protein